MTPHQVHYHHVVESRFVVDVYYAQLLFLCPFLSTVNNKHKAGSFSIFYASIQESTTAYFLHRNRTISKGHPYLKNQHYTLSLTANAHFSYWNIQLQRLHFTVHHSRLRDQSLSPLFFRIQQHKRCFTRWLSYGRRPTPVLPYQEFYLSLASWQADPFVVVALQRLRRLFFTITNERRLWLSTWHLDNILAQSEAACMLQMGCYLFTK